MRLTTKLALGLWLATLKVPFIPYPASSMSLLLVPALSSEEGSSNDKGIVGNSASMSICHGCDANIWGQAKSGASGQALEEAKTINKSLSALGQVINALTDPKSKGTSLLLKYFLISALSIWGVLYIIYCGPICVGSIAWV